MRAAGDARARRQRRPELPSGRARTARTCWSCCRSICPCRCAIPLRSARNSRSSRRVPAPCCSPHRRAAPTANASSSQHRGCRRRTGDTRRRSRRGSTRRAALGYEMRRRWPSTAAPTSRLPVRDHTGAVMAALTVPFLPQKAARFDRETVFSAGRSVPPKGYRPRSAPASQATSGLIVPTRDGGTNRPELNPKVIGRRSMNWSKTFLFASTAAIGSDGRCAGAGAEHAEEASATSSTTPRTNGTRTSSRA